MSDLPKCLYFDVLLPEKEQYCYNELKSEDDCEGCEDKALARWLRNNTDVVPSERENNTGIVNDHDNKGDSE